MMVESMKIMMMMMKLLMKNVSSSSPTPGDEALPPLPAMSLLDHNLAFRSSVYCVTTGVQNDEYGSITTTMANHLSREQCDECTGCQWKRRRGFTSELEWQTAVTAELERLVGAGSFNSLYNNKEEQEEEGVEVEVEEVKRHDQELVGSWIVEAPPTMALHVDTLDEMSASLGVQLGDSVIVSEDSGRRFFVVSGTPSVVKGVLSAGFISLTPIPPRLKVDPALEEELYAAEEAAAAARHHVSLLTSSNGSNSTLSSSKAWGTKQEDQQEQTPFHSGSLTAHLSSLPLLLVGGGSTKNRRSSSRQHNLGHAKVEEVLAGGGNKVAIGGLQTRVDALEAALDIAMHGHVMWVGRKPKLVSADYFASKLVQQWPPTLPGMNEVPPKMDWEGWAWRRDDPPRLFADLGLTGEGEVVGVADTNRLDFRSCFFSDSNEMELTFTETSHKHLKMKVFTSETHRKIKQYVIGHDKGYGGYTTYGEKGEHEVTGALAGYLPGSYPDGKFTAMGVASLAKVAFYECLNEDESEDSVLKKVVKKVSKALKKKRYTTDNDLAEHVFPQAYNVGARVYTIAFGHIGTYDDTSRPLDKFCYKHQDFITFVAAGNDGDATPTNVGTIRHPATAKNAVAVGSHLNVGAGGPAYKRSKNYNRPDKLTEYSSRGPTDDGRIKPDVCGPGEDLLLPFPNVDSPGYDDEASSRESCNTVYREGTSYAAPTVAGVAVLVRQYFTKGYYPDGEKNDDDVLKPMGALLKAVIVNSGRPLYKGMVKSKPMEPEPAKLPNNDMGWGGVDVSTTLVLPSSPKNQALQVFGEWSEGCKDCPQLYAGDTCEYTFEVSGNEGAPNNIPLKITLVWYDYPSQINARRVMVNNLDLSAAVLGTTHDHPETAALNYYPNGLSEADKDNNVEHIAIPAPTGSTTYSVKVKGTKVPMSPQPFALVISGPFDTKVGVKDDYSPGKTMIQKKKRRGNCGRLGGSSNDEGREEKMKKKGRSWRKGKSG